MNSFLQLLIESVWRVLPTADLRGVARDAYLRPFILLAIVLLVGPELVAVAELTTLLDLLGATMFLFAFGVGYKILGRAVLEWLHRLLVPAEYSMLIKVGRPSAIAFGVLFIVANGLALLVLSLTAYAGISALVRLTS